ncbi:MAG: electron transfer flavoprotein subunit beta [Paenibacillaceae bacterium ZCTH02-B3]|nr:MAG: electron transfer flavoprotein subunit beta [Paenibacillaceae bacterium ZCTH02-B3]
MNILVLLKQTFDTEERIRIENGKISEEDVKFIINPYDEYAVEEAIRIKEEHGGEVTVVSVGPMRTESALRTALAMGADRAILVHDESLSGIEYGDEHTLSKILARVARRTGFDLILAGYMSVDSGAAQVAPRVAEELDIPHISAITGLRIEGNAVVAEKDMEGNKAVIEASLPVLLTAQQGLNEPRFPTLPNIMRAKKKPLEIWTVADLELDFGSIQPKTAVAEQYLPPPKPAGRILEGSLDSQVRELAQLLKDLIS